MHNITDQLTFLGNYETLLSDNKQQRENLILFTYSFSKHLPEYNQENQEPDIIKKKRQQGISEPKYRFYINKFQLSRRLFTGNSFSF